MVSSTITRRRVLQTGAVSAAALSLPFVHGAHAAGKLNVAFWDHWVPGANDVMKKLCQEWADKEKVELKIDFVTSQGDKLMLTAAAEAQAKSGHDMMTLPSGTRRRRPTIWNLPTTSWPNLISDYGETTRAVSPMSASRRATGSRRRPSRTR